MVQTPKTMNQTVTLTKDQLQNLLTDAWRDNIKYPTKSIEAFIKGYNFDQFPKDERAGNEAVEFGEWILKEDILVNFDKDGNSFWSYGEKNLTTQQLFDIFKKRDK